MLKEVIDESGEKVVIACAYKGITFSLVKKLRKAGYAVEVINGDIGTKKRDEIIWNFQNAKDPRIVVCMPQVVSHGLTLTASNQIVWWSPPDSNEMYQQLNNRCDRPGQKSSVTITHLSGHAIENKIYQKLKDRENYQSDVLNMYEDFIRG